MIPCYSTPPCLGFGLGLRSQHYDEILATKPKIDWFEILTENYLVPGGKPLYYLDQICQHYPVAMHGVSLSIGGTDPLNLTYLAEIKKLMNRVQPKWISDHLCWTGVDGVNLHDLLPLPYTQQTIDHVVERISRVQDYFDQRLVIENISSYLCYEQSEMSEWEFLSEVTKKADCLILLDINNIFVNAFNHHFSAEAYLKNIPHERVVQMHLAGHVNQGDVIIDTHDSAVLSPVWSLYKTAIDTVGLVSTCIERDANIPPLSELIEEMEKAREIATAVTP